MNLVGSSERVFRDLADAKVADFADSEEVGQVSVH